MERTEAMQRPREGLDLRIHGLDCAEEARELRVQVEKLAQGRLRFGIHALEGRLTIENPELLEDGELDVAVKRAGLRAAPWTEAGTGPPTGGSHLRTTLFAACAAGGAFVLHASSAGISEALNGSEQLPLGPRLLYLTAMIAGLRLAAPKALVSARRLRPDMNLLMLVAVCGAVAVGEWFEAATVSVLFAFSLELERWSVGRARRAVEGLLQRTPDQVRIPAPDGGTHFVPASRFPVGDPFVVLPGDKIPLDGEVIEGLSEVDQAPITGESLPVPKEPGDPVFAGTLNGDGNLQVRATRRAEESTFARISKLIVAARAQRSPSERWVDSFAARYTPSVILLSIACALLPPLFLGGVWSTWVYRGLVLLVIACPCALVISTPVSIVCALGAAAKKGILVKGGDHLEAAARIRAIAFDKTGTLSSGKLQLERIVPLLEHSPNALLRAAAALESRSNHPLARAVVSAAQAEGIEIPEVENLTLLRGRGLQGLIDGERFWLGSHRYLEERNQEESQHHEALERLSEEGRSLIVVGKDDHVCGFLALADSPRPSAKASLAALRSCGIDNLAMLTGDNPGSASALAAAIGLDQISANLLPEDKVQQIEEMEARFGPVAMVGDGINDAPALARSSLGIAIGAGGSDIAIETADIALLSSNLELIPWLITLARQTRRIIKQNISFALGTKLIVLGLAVLGSASLWTAIAADMGASFLVIINAMRPLVRQPSSAAP